MDRKNYHLSVAGDDASTRLVFGHQRANEFATKAEAIQVATEVLRSDSFCVWYRTAKGYQQLRHQVFHGAVVEKATVAA